MDSLQKPPSSITVLENGDIVTPDGLKLKHIDGIEMINVRLEGRLDTPFYSWQVCRLVRRDFNFVAVKLFHREKRHGGREQVRSLAHEVRLQAELLADECTGFGAPPPGDGKLVPIRLVSPIAAGLYRSFLIADAAYAKLNHAVSAGKIQLNQLHGYTREFEQAFSDLKLYCSTRNQQEKTAQELASSEGIA